MTEPVRRPRRARAPALLLPLLAAACGPGPDAPRERVFLPEGISFGAVTDSLDAHGIIGNRAWFRLVARLGGFDRRVRSGLYEFRRGERARSVLQALAAGRALAVRFTVPEGYTLLDIAALAERDLRVPADSLLAATRDRTLLDELGVPGQSLEGYLYPDTYLWSGAVSAGALVRRLAETFRQRWDPAWDARARELGLDRHQLLTLASIVEGEARVDEDRPLVAAVYRNRLRMGMALQADPTVQYAIQLASGKRKPRLYEKDYRVESPYNTYLHPGLPPGPVGAPGRASIDAVLAGAEAPWLYFVAGPDGKHVFSRTYAEHLRAVRRARQAANGAR
ncbi:MAG: endolytic transglycosylase MltG [Gemmatimonadales bacterium]